MWLEKSSQRNKVEGDDDRTEKKNRLLIFFLTMPHIQKTKQNRNTEKNQFLPVWRNKKFFLVHDICCFKSRTEQKEGNEEKSLFCVLWALFGILLQKVSLKNKALWVKCA